MKTAQTMYLQVCNAMILSKTISLYTLSRGVSTRVLSVLKHPLLACYLQAMKTVAMSLIIFIKSGLDSPVLLIIFIKSGLDSSVLLKTTCNLLEAKCSLS